jgi:hypothetical protein
VSDEAGSNLDPGARLKTPRAAAIAGILFSVLLIAGLFTVPAFGPDRSSRYSH